MPEREGGLSRRQFLTTAAAGAAAAFVSCRVAARSATARAAGPPNVVLILADDLGYNGVGVQGCTDIPTPSIDAIAAAGTRFTSGYVTCPVCSPTRAGLMTGRYQQRFGHEFNPGPEAGPEFGIARDEVLLPERLRSLGYATGMFGKWHLGDREGFLPTDRGFDEFYGFLGGAHQYIARQATAAPILRGTEPVEETRYLTDAIAAEASDFIQRHRDRPFFLYVPFNAVHTPMQAVRKYVTRFPGIADQKRRTHAAMLAAMDDGIGRIVGTLRDRGLEDNTLIFFLSDNGGPTGANTSSNAPLRGVKGQVWDGGIRIPYMIQWKGHVPAGKVDDRPLSSLDIHHTAVVAAGGTVAPEWKLDGVDLVPLIAGDDTTTPPQQRLFWRFGANQKAVRDGDMKLVWQATETPALYDLAADIGESRDLSAEQPEKVDELRNVLDEWNAELMEPRWQRQGGNARPAAGNVRGRAGRAERATG